jgi:uncharacterized phage infection (PIP) family protein YhgE
MPDTFDPASAVIDPNPDADLSNADFGNTVVADTAVDDAKPSVAEPTKSKSDEPAKPSLKRDENGRFVKDAPDASNAETPGDGEPQDPPEGDTAVGDPAADPEGDGRAKMVPLSRFQEVVNQRNDLASRLSEAQKEHSQAQVQARDELKEIIDGRDKLYEEVETLRADGDTKGAAKLQRQIDEANHKLSDIKAGMVARQEAFMQNENSSYNRMLDQLETAMPAMNPNAPEFDRATVEEMEFQVQAYTKMGMPPTQALRRAAVLIFREDPFAPRTTAKAEAADKPAAATAPATKKTNVAKNVDAANRSAPEVGHKSDIGDGKGSKSIFDMSDDELAALPASVLARMRGDTLA